ncbi:hypothetical protein ADICEAN_03676 [Cesiribacter andamanensis AMV16]|uniref:Uncharacterized protein n=2 Tax=Cesiribacter TaxID=1133570 RepID=M7N1U7_9BACT|nr:hypothetical protein ADICEAN_03676 [Cesiribacter andamanensis AMV16]
MLCSSQVVAQKLKADQYEISISEWDVRQTEDFGQLIIDYKGSLKVKEEKKLCKRKYTFYFASSDGKLSHLTFATKKGDIIPPKLYYNEVSKTFSIGSPEGRTVATHENATLEQVVMSGMLIWLRNQR